MAIGPVRLHQEGSARDAAHALRDAGIDSLIISGGTDLDDLDPGMTQSLALVEIASLLEKE